ncbi:cyclic nucleotide-binding domain-containing protein, partial [Nostoc sp. NIES-2111]
MPDEAVRLQLLSLPFFSALSPAHQTEVSRWSLIHTFPEQAVVMREGKPQEYLFAVIEGRVEFSVLDQGTRYITQVEESGTVFSLPAVLLQDGPLSTVCTTTRSRIMMTPARVIRDIVATDAQAAFAAAECVSRYSQGLVRTLYEQRFRTAPEKLAGWVLRQADPSKPSQQIPLAMAKQQIAGVLGMSSESLSRALALLGAHGGGIKTGTSSIPRLDDVRRMVPPP